MSRGRGVHRDDDFPTRWLATRLGSAAVLVTTFLADDDYAALRASAPRIVVTAAGRLFGAAWQSVTEWLAVRLGSKAFLIADLLADEDYAMFGGILMSRNANVPRVIVRLTTELGRAKGLDLLGMKPSQASIWSTLQAFLGSARRTVSFETAGLLVLGLRETRDSRVAAGLIEMLSQRVKSCRDTLVLVVGLLSSRVANEAIDVLIGTTGTKNYRPMIWSITRRLGQLQEAEYALEILADEADARLDRELRRKSRDDDWRVSAAAKRCLVTRWRAKEEAIRAWSAKKANRR
mmetsp:Transcript_156211/g.501175  ORF Transcript_156211/g.501175 Transcript_156211/m.501175 type:complete len:291 (-) Transcript_156211:374-1246(-)